MHEIEKLILGYVTQVFQAGLSNDQLDKIADEIIADSNTEDTRFLVNNGFAGMGASLPLDTYVNLPYRSRVLVGLSEMGCSIGDDYVPMRPNKFRYGGYKPGPEVS